MARFPGKGLSAQSHSSPCKPRHVQSSKIGNSYQESYQERLTPLIGEIFHTISNHHQNIFILSKYLLTQIILLQIDYKLTTMTTVLVIEDSKSTRKMMSQLLSERGLKVKTAPDGVQALKMLPTISPDVVVLDIVMPNMNGYEVCRKIKANPKTKDVPVIICSAKSEDFDRYWGIKQGADAYIAKPFEKRELIATINQFLKTTR